MTPPTPPPIPQNWNPTPARNIGYGTKLVLIALIGVLLMIASFIVWGFTSSREHTSNITAKEIAHAWGEQIRVGDMSVECDSIVVSPKIYRCVANVESQRLHRSIYEASVYEADIEIGGEIELPVGIGEYYHVVLDISPAGVSFISPLVINGRQYVWARTKAGFMAEVDSGDYGQFQFGLGVKGSQGISFKLCGEHNDVDISGNCSDPSFGLVDEDYTCDYPLPNKRSITKEHFKASWHRDSSISEEVSVARVQFLLGVDRYQKVERSLKYAFLIILFTFLSVFFAERITKCPIPVLNYLLMGLALILFYVLLLSLCEHMSFGMAYTLASTMTVTLIAAYMWGMLRSVKVAGVIFAILGVMYLSCYVLLCLSSYALIMGSLMMFCALAVSMYASLKIK